MMTITQENIVQTGQPSRTAWRVAMLRAAHQLLDEPVVLEDPVALRILGTKTEAELREDPFVHNDPLSRGLRAALVVRSRFAEDELARAVAAGIRQYVVLGAGLDTFAYRNPHDATGLRVFEVDHPSTQQWKRSCLAEAGIPLSENLTFAPVDFEHGTLAQGLAEAGFRTDLPTCFSWLGVTMYLTEAAIMESLSFVAHLPRNSSISFDYQVLPSMLDPIARVIIEVMGQRAAAVGEPWISAFDPVLLRQKVLGLGFSEAETCEPDELNRRYLYRRKDGLHTGGRLMCARV
jgi:methyltransferase (TIGR00027 family)